MTPAALYCRFSPRRVDAEVDKIESIDFQEDYLRRYCQTHELDVGEVIHDPMVSARLKPLHKRPGGQRLLELTTGRAPQYRAVVAYRLDRISRSIVDGSQVMARWTRAGVALHLAAEGGQAINTSTAFGWYMAHARLLQCEFESLLTAERTSDAMQRMSRKGRKIGGSPPYGLRLVDGAWIEAPEEMAAVREIIELSKTLSPREVAKAMDDRGFPCRGGRRWHHVTIRRILERHRRVEQGEPL